MYTYNRKYIEQQILGPFLVLNTIVLLFITFLMITISQNSSLISDTINDQTGSDKVVAWIFDHNEEGLFYLTADPVTLALEQCQAIKNTVLSSILPSGTCPMYALNESKTNLTSHFNFSFNENPNGPYAFHDFYFSKDGPKFDSFNFLGLNINSASNLSSYQKKAMPFHPIIHQAAQRYEVEPAIIKAIIMAESSFNPKAVSRKGAQGLMQLMPRTAKYLGVQDSFNPEHNIDGGVKYFKRLLDRFDGDIQLALAAYNAGSRNVRKYNGVPPFKATQRYIQKVMKYYEQYKTT